MNSSGEDESMFGRSERDLAGQTTAKAMGDAIVGRVQQDHPMLQTAHQHQEVKRTHYPYKEPRIDQKMYQAEIPRLQGRTSNRAITRGSSSPRAGEEVSDDIVVQFCIAHLRTFCFLSLRRRQCTSVRSQTVFGELLLR